MTFLSSKASEAAKQHADFNQTRYEEYLIEWRDISKTDWKAVKAFIDTKKDTPEIDLILESGELKQAGITAYRMKPDTYLKLARLKDKGIKPNIGEIVEKAINDLYDNV